MADADRIHVACATNAGYFRHCAAMLASVLEFNPGVSVHVLCTDDVPADDRVRLSSWGAERGATIRCVTPATELPADLPGMRRLTRAAWLRLFLPDLLSDQPRVIYLDVDLIVRGSLRELWDLDLGGNWAAAVTDIPHIDHEPLLHRRVGFASAAEYFNSGVLLMDLDRFRQERVGERVLRFAAEHPEQVLLADQDPLNVVLGGHRLPLPLRWNVLSPIYEGGIIAAEFPFTAQEAQRAREAPAIVHFSGPWKPWHLRSRHPLRRLYADYRAQTPWPEWGPDGRTLKHRILRVLPEPWVRSLTIAYSIARRSVGFS